MSSSKFIPNLLYCNGKAIQVRYQCKELGRNRRSRELFSYQLIDLVTVTNQVAMVAAGKLKDGHGNTMFVVNGIADFEPAMQEQAYVHTPGSFGAKGSAPEPLKPALDHFCIKAFHIHLRTPQQALAKTCSCLQEAASAAYGVQFQAHVHDSSKGTKSAKATPVNFLAANRLVTAGSVTTADIERFNDEGFKMIGRVKLSDAPLPTPTVDTDSKPSAPPSGPLFAARITPTGHLYLQPEAAAKKAAAAVASRGQAGSPPFCPSCSTTTSTAPTTTPPSRKLLVWAADKRQKVKKAVYPYSAVGQLVGVGESWRGYACSGALFSPSYVLTAGHCVQSVKGVWSRNLNFYPGRLSKSATKGVYNWVWATSWWVDASSLCLDGTCPGGALYNDYAVIRLSEAVGKRTGYLGLASDIPYEWDETLTSAGYPSSKPFGTMWKTSGKLTSPYYYDDSYYMMPMSYLDVDAGQFGSAAWDSTNTTMAIVVGMNLKGLAMLRLITYEIYNAIMGVR
ncbi:hypothetical protein N2152v2_001047 [Parachlorella kessleri]